MTLIIRSDFAVLKVNDEGAVQNHSVFARLPGHRSALIHRVVSTGRAELLHNEFHRGGRHAAAASHVEGLRYAIVNFLRSNGAHTSDAVSLASNEQGGVHIRSASQTTIGIFASVAGYVNVTAQDHAGTCIARTQSRPILTRSLESEQVDDGGVKEQ